MSEVSGQPEAAPEIERQAMEVDIACVGFGPAMGGFLTTLTREMSANPDEAAMESKAVPGMPLQVLCYERADDIAAGVSGVVTRGNAIRASFPELDPSEIPMAVPVKQEKILYLLDPIGASRRSLTLRAGDAAIRALRSLLPVEHDALELPYTPEFLQKHHGLVMSIGQFNQWVGGQVHVHRTGAGVAGNTGEYGALRWQGRDRGAAGRSGSGSRLGLRMRVSWQAWTCARN